MNNALRILPLKPFGILMLGLVLLTSCARSAEELIAKNWELDMHKIKDEIKEEWKERLEEVNINLGDEKLQRRVDEFVGMMGKTYLKIDKNGKYYFDSMGFRSKKDDKGTWSIDEKGTTLTCTSVTKEKYTITIEDLGKSSMTLKTDNPDFPLLHFVVVDEEEIEQDK